MGGPNFLRNMWITLWVGMVLGVGSYTMATTQQTSVMDSARLTRACMFPIGGAAIVDCSNVAAADVQLNAWSSYVMQCRDDSYVATGDATGDDADSGDLILPDKEWLRFMTTDSVRFVSCLNINLDSACYVWECQ